MSDSQTPGSKSKNQVIRELVKGREQIVSYAGTSQFGGQGGTSACGLAALNFARIAFSVALEDPLEDIQEIVSSETAQVRDICLEFSRSGAH